MAVVLAVMLSVAAALPGPGARHLPPRLSRLGIRQPRLGIRPCAEGPFAEGMFGALRLRGGIDTAAEVCPRLRRLASCHRICIYESDMQLRIRGSEAGALMAAFRC